MTNKLTKNDSVKKCGADLHSFFEQDPFLFFELQGKFENMLSRKGIRLDYFKEWEKAKNYKGTANVFYAWRQWAKERYPESWIISAFEWGDSRRGYHFWELMNQEWINCCLLYLKNTVFNLKNRTL